MTKKPTTKAAAAVPATAAKKRGRPAVAPEDRAVVGAIRLTVDQWSKFHALGGAVWLRERIAKAKDPA
jgi:uncharacterized protein (DUF4415 family)